MIDATLLIAGVAILLFLMCIGGYVIDELDPYGEREDARRRNRRG